MFGRVRASSSSLDSLEGPPSKILKDDSFSLYEATLMKLKLGAQRDLSLHSKEAAGTVIDSAISSSCVEGINAEANCNPASSSTSQNVGILHNERTLIDPDCSSLSTSPSYSDCHSTGSSGKHRSRHASVLHLFTKFESSKHAVNSPYGEPMPIEDGCSATISSSSS
ncbi:Up-regulator of cell proliferation like [Quillaja saponaria]|uniref:Up-regulator of cell proliferation like n=1 Tax=Quillaja saponaria TaxID=32244 RepID=A0AAD7LDZ0_QUISA|nr:Up-regulator of cell proliferation like [Quillaja saponaria]